MTTKQAKDENICKTSSIAIRKACYMSIALKLGQLIDNIDIITLRDFKYAVFFADFEKAEVLKTELCSKYLRRTKSGADLLAKSLNVSVQTVQNWKSGKVLIPALMAKSLHAAVGIALWELRPDLYEKPL